MGNKHSGRKPIPTALKLLRGNPGQRKINQHEPKPPEGAVTAPKALSKGAKQVWARLAPICQEMGTLTTADVLAFAKLCELEATAARIAREKDAPDFQMVTAMGQLATVVRLERDTALALRSFYEFFGLTPSSRTRLVVPKPAEQPTSKWAEIG